MPHDVYEGRVNAKCLWHTHNIYEKNINDGNKGILTKNYLSTVTNTGINPYS